MRPLQGTALASPTGLRFLISGNPPVLVDLDRRRTTRVTGLADGQVVLRVGASTVVNRECIGCTPRVYVTRDGSTEARQIATGTAVAATSDRRGVWLMTQPGRGRCALNRIGLDGSKRSDPRPIDCRHRPLEETPLGLLCDVWTTTDNEYVVLAKNTMKPIFRATGIIQILGNRALTSEYGQPLKLTDIRTGRVTELPAPTTVGYPSYGVPSPDGRWLAVSYESPAWPGPRQRMDLWLLDIRSLRWLHAPSMPVPLSLKDTSLAWTADNRLVLLGTFDATADSDIDETFDAVAVWRPGDPQLSVRRITLPVSAGSFVMSGTGSRYR